MGFIGIWSTIEFHDAGEIRTKVAIDSASEFNVRIDYEFPF
jgi:hypothetical protein